MNILLLTLVFSLYNIAVSIYYSFSELFGCLLNGKKNFKTSLLPGTEFAEVSIIKSRYLTESGVLGIMG
jgi:hypothetical protein